MRPRARAPMLGSRWRRKPRIGPAGAVVGARVARPSSARHARSFARARDHLRVVLGAGLFVGAGLGFSAIIVPRWGQPWFTVSLGIVIGVMMLTYVTLPARIVGIRPTGSRVDRLAAAAIGGALGLLVCTPPYVIGRIGILLLGSHALFLLGVVLLAIGLTLQAGATGAVKAIKMSAKLAAGDVSRPSSG